MLENSKGRAHVVANPRNMDGVQFDFIGMNPPKFCLLRLDYFLFSMICYFFTVIQSTSRVETEGAAAGI